MDWKGPIAATIFAALVLCAGFWIEPMFPLGDNRWGVAAGLCVMAVVLLYTPSVLRWWRRRSRARSAAPADLPASVDFLGAGAIIDGYIEPMMHGKRDISRLAVRRDFIDRFEKAAGAKLGEYEYNAARLHEWMQSNAARFLVEKHGDMR